MCCIDRLNPPPIAVVRASVPNVCCQRERDKAKLPVSGRSRRPAIDSVPPLDLPAPTTASCGAFIDLCLAAQGRLELKRLPHFLPASRLFRLAVPNSFQHEATLALGN